MQLQTFFYFGALAVVIFPSEILCSHHGDIKVLIGGVGTGKVGEITTFNAVVVTKPDARTSLNASERVNFEFSWKVSSRPWVILKHERTRRRWDNFQWRWTEAGDHMVFVYVRILDGNGNDLARKQRPLTGYSSYFATNETKVTVRESDGEDEIIATLDAYQNPSLKGDQNKLYVGAVTLEVKIHNFPHQNLSNVTYDWNFGDGTNFTSSHLQKVIHNFTTVKSCTVVVNLFGWIQGKLYKGKANKTLQFKGDIHPHLVIKCSSGPKLPSNNQNAFPTDIPLEFEVNFKDPYNLITGVSTDWKFGDGSSVRRWPKRTISHTFHKEGKYSNWLTVRVNTKFLGKKSFSVERHLCVKDPVYLKVRHRHLEHKDKTVRFNISCNGSLPVSFHWCVTKQCHLPPGEICSPMMEYRNSCSLIVNHRFNDAGQYCVNIGVMNDVSGTNTSLMVQIPGGDIPVPKHNHRRTSLTGIIVALFVLCILLIVVAVIVARKWIYSKKKKTEKADFEFRDLDALSVSSVELYGKKTCFGRCGSIWSSRKAEESMPLFRDTQLYTL